MKAERLRNKVTGYEGVLGRKVRMDMEISARRPQEVTVRIRVLTMNVELLG